MSSPARRCVFDASEVRPCASKQLSFCSRNFQSVSNCFRPTGMMTERDVRRPQRRGRRKVQASAQDPLILVERIVIAPPTPRAAAPGSAAYPPAHRTGQTPKGLFWRPASLGEDQPARIGSTPKQACQFKRLVTFRTGRHQPRKFQGVYSEGTPIIPTS
jgi:hypothetical protein